MATKIRLRRVGRKGQPSYRIVVMEQTTPRDGLAVATVGHYNPRPKNAELAVDAEQVRYWLSKGATPTDTVRSLLKKAGVFSAAPASPAAG